MRKLTLSAGLLSASVVVALAQMPFINGVVDSARFGARLAPGSLATLIGGNFGTVPLQLTVLVSGKQAHVLQVGPTYANIQVPVDAPEGPATVTAERLSQRSLPFNTGLYAYAPGLFVKNPEIFNQNPNAIGEGVFVGVDGAALGKDRPASPGESVSAFAAGLGETTPIVPTGMVAPSSPIARTRALPQITVGGKSATVLTSALNPGQIGAYVVTFVVPVGLEAGTYQVKLEIGGVASNIVNIPVGQPLPQVNALVNAATPGSLGVVAPGSIATFWGANFGVSYKLGLYPATVFEGVSVTFNNVPAPLFDVVGAQGQINLLVPTELPESGDISVQLRYGASASPVYSLKMVPVQPGIFRIQDPSNPVRRTAAALFANTAWRVMPSSQARAFGWPDNCSGLSAAAVCGQPAAPGDNVQVYATGLGRATPGGSPSGSVLPTGSIAPSDGNPLYRTVQTPTVLVGGVQVTQMQFSGLAPGFAGLYQVNFQIPPGAPAGDDVTVTLSLPGAPADTATIAIRR